jgi:hypothetical protein
MKKRRAWSLVVTECGLESWERNNELFASLGDWLERMMNIWFRKNAHDSAAYLDYEITSKEYDHRLKLGTTACFDHVLAVLNAMGVLDCVMLCEKADMLGDGP